MINDEEEIVEETNEYEGEKEVTEAKKKLVFQADWPSIILRLALILFFCFIFIFVITKYRKYRKETVFNKNMETVRLSAYNYFKKEENRPEELTEEIVLPLQEMIDEKIIVDVKPLEKDNCDKQDSYVSLLKKTEDKYDMDVHLNCEKFDKTNTYAVNYRQQNGTTTDEDDSSSTVTQVLYEQKRKVKDDDTYVCPDGFNLVGHKCYGNVNILSVEAIPQELSNRREVAASYMKEQVTSETVNPKIVSKSQVSCQNGKLINGKCQITTELSDIYQEIYSCPDGGSLNGNKCLITINPVKVEAKYRCSIGTLVNDKCVITKNSQKSCISGKYDSTKKMCYTTYEASVNYSEWQFAYYVSFSKKNSPTNSNTALYVKYQELDNGTIKYKKYKRTKISNNCQNGDVYQNGKCRHYNQNDEKDTCPTGYSLTSSKTCSKTVTAKQISRAKLTCPTGYKLSNNKCVLTKSAASQKIVEQTCPSGYDLINDNCVKYENAIIKENVKTYNCPEGYDLIQKDNEVYCSKQTITAGYYYCKDESYQLVGNKCISNNVTQKYSCPTGYVLSGNMCYKHTNEEVKSATLIRGKTNEEYIWSEEKKLDGWIWTGKTKEA